MREGRAPGGGARGTVEETYPKNRLGNLPAQLDRGWSTGPTQPGATDREPERRRLNRFGPAGAEAL